MLSQAQRATILELQVQGVGKRQIARLLKISRQSVRQVLQANSSAVPRIERAEKATPFRQQILELLSRCKGNLVRVHEELVAAGATFSYQALTAFCRREGIGQEPSCPWAATSSPRACNRKLSITRLIVCVSDHLKT